MLNTKRSLAAAVILAGAIAAGRCFAPAWSGSSESKPPLGGRAAAGDGGAGERAASPELPEDSPLPERELQDYVDSTSLEQLPGRVEAVANAPQSGQTHDLWLRLVRRWGLLDARSAAEWAFGIPEALHEVRTEAMSQVAIAWANTDLQGSLDWVSHWPGGAERESARIAVAYEGARTDPVGALELASGLPFNQETANLVSYSASQWAARDPLAAWQWSRQIPDLRIRETLQSNIAVSWAAHDAAAAAERLQEMPPGRALDDAVVGIVQHWVQVDPASAREWLARNPGSPEARESASRAAEAIRRQLDSEGSDPSAAR